MREIKFRAWDKENKQWLRDSFLLCSYGGKDNSIEISTESCGTEHGQRDCDIDLMQFTGLLDKNGKEIYDGDFLPALYGPQLVRWNEESARWDGVRENGYDTPSGWCSQREVIGNIHENPSLLEEN